jgi:hypothetical protein
MPRKLRKTKQELIEQEGRVECVIRDINMPVMPRLLEDYANQVLQRAGIPRRVSKIWAYRFEKRLPENLNLGPVKQNTKESKRIQAEDAGLLAHWYDQLASVVKQAPARLVYNFDECGFQPGEGRSRKVISFKGKGLKGAPDLPESEKGENITAIECIAADGWLMDPFFIFKGMLLLFLFFFLFFYSKTDSN